MSIAPNEIIWRASAQMNDSASNGGRMTATAIPSAVKNNVWPDVPQSERVAGSTKYRKVFIHVANDDDLALQFPRVFVETQSPGEDSVSIFLGTQTNQQSAITGSERTYGCGNLDANVSIGGSQITVATEGAAYNHFQDGDLIRISDKPTVDGAGNVQYVTISGAPSYAGAVATIDLAQPLDYNFVAANTRVASVLEPGDVKADYDNLLATTVGNGDYDDTSYPVELDSIGTVEQTITLSFTSATNFNVTSDVLGSMGTGNTSSDLQPTNTDFAKPYFILRSDGFTGTWASGDTLVFQTHPAAIPVWYKRVVPAGAASLSADKVIVGVDGQSQ